MYTDTHIKKAIIQYKNYLNKHAEVGWEEIKTTAFVKKTLSCESVIDGIGDNQVGLITTLGKGSKKIFLRADLDALPTDSRPQHLCGHSTHTATLMGAYVWLKSQEQMLKQLDKEVIFVFQPAEETYPSGAKTLLERHPFIFAACDFGFGVHVDPTIPLGTIRLLSKEACGAGDYIEIEIKGKQYHVKNTHQAIDAIEGGALVIQAVRTFQKEFSQFGETVVFNLNTIHGGTAPNITADYVKMTGDIRWIHKHDQKKIKTFFKKLPTIIKKHFKGTVSIHYYDGYPPVYNSPQLAVKIHSLLNQYKPKLQIVNRGVPTLGIEDFAFYTHHVPCLYADIGIGGRYDLHEEGFAVSDEATWEVYEYWKMVLTWWMKNN